MPLWVHSRRLKVLTLAAIGLLTTGGCGGAVLANYTVAGMDPVYIAQVQPAGPAPSRGAADWLAEKAFKNDRGQAAFADPWKPEPAQAAN